MTAEERPKRRRGRPPKNPAATPTAEAPAPKRWRPRKSVALKPNWTLAPANGTEAIMNDAVRKLNERRDSLLAEAAKIERQVAHILRTPG